MKMALVRRGFSSSGGAEAYLERLAAGLLAAGQDPVLVTNANWPPDRWPGCEIRRVTGHSPQAFARCIPAASADCSLVFSLERIGACDIFRACDGVHLAWAQRRARIEPSWRRWLRVFNTKNLQLLALEAETFSPRGARTVIANSEMVRREIHEHFDFPEHRVHVVYNGLDPAPDAPAREASRRDLGISRDACVALFVGTGWERKGLSTAIQAVQETPDITLLVAGRGRMRGHLPGNVRLLGAVPGVAKLLSASDVFVLPTVYDPFSNACLEALAAGLPVITTRANGFSEIIDDGVHGTIIETGNVRALVGALQTWATVPVAESVRTSCKERASRFSLAENVNRTLAVVLGSSER